MIVLLIGSGGREHALAWKFSLSPLVTKIYAAPGNPGMANVPKVENIPVEADDLQGLFTFAQQKNVDLTFVGPEKPLSMGIVDLFQEKQLRIFGPNKEAAQLEASKEFAKKIMIESGVPTAYYNVFTDFYGVEKYLKTASFPIVLKADGLASGKGVQVCQTHKEALEFANDVLVDKVFGDSGTRLVVEEFLDGRECSILVITDGKSYKILSSAQDHKRLLDNDEGPNTGGMGAYSPSPIFDFKLETLVHEKVFRPVFETLKKKGIQYTGILYAGLMVTKSGPKVLEFNVRFGDPETQVILPRMKNDFFEIIMDATKGELSKHQLQWTHDSCVTVVLAAKDYPQKPSKGDTIEGLKKNDLVFHAGTAQQGNKIVTAGGRVLNVTALGETIADARSKVYHQISDIHFNGMQYRKDIGM